MSGTRFKTETADILNPRTAAGAAILGAWVMDNYIPTEPYEIRAALDLANSYLKDGHQPQAVTPIDIFLAIGDIREAFKKFS